MDGHDQETTCRTNCPSILRGAWILLALVLLARPSPAQERADRAARVDAGTMKHKVLCGYQGWFRCPGDGTSDGWLHWSRHAARLTPKDVTFEMWPDLSEFADDEKYAVPGLKGQDGSTAWLFSSANANTVRRHFGWMKTHGIDGVFVQRFLVELGRPSLGTVLSHVRASAAESGRVYAVCYDLTGAPITQLYELLVSDWKGLVDEKRITSDEGYLHHRGKPVLMVWGFFHDRFDAATAHRIIDFFQSDPRYGVTLIGGCEWPWRTVQDAEWSRVFRRLDVVSPWNVGNYALVDGKKVAATGSWEPDLAETRRHGIEFMPVVYPGFGWTNLKGINAAAATIPRRKGEFYWRQFVDAAELGVDMVYVAMFDEVDEGTAIFKVSNHPPRQPPFQTYEGMPSDEYLRLTGEASGMIGGERKPKRTLPRGP